jgi:ribokinase
MGPQQSVLVVGSINIDCTVAVKKLPMPRETIHGNDAIYRSGGKGGNQAVALVAANSAAIMIGAVGNDAQGVQAISSLQSHGVSTLGVSQMQDSTGTAFIFVEESGENLIVVTPGANALVSADDVENRIRQFSRAASPVVLAQMELPMQTVERAAFITQELGGRFVLNLAPAVEISEQLLACCNPIILNEPEAEFLLGRKINGKQGALEALGELSKRVKSAVITLGSEGAVYFDGNAGTGQSGYAPAQKVDVVDTTGAGDAFVGSLVAALSQGSTMGMAVEIGISAGSAAVQYFGAQPSDEDPKG